MTTVVCKWRKCRFNNDETCTRTTIVLEEIPTNKADALECASFSEEGKANGQA